MKEIYLTCLFYKLLQLKKLQDKVKHFEDLELIMENENTQLEEAEQSLIMERLDVLQRAFDAGIPKSKGA